MGNHEFCPNCEQSDFHRGEPCLPQHVAEAEARRARIEACKCHTDEYCPTHGGQAL